MLYVSNKYHDRILVFNAAAGLANGAAASYVLGQTKFTTSTSGSSATTLHEPTGLFYDPSSKALWAANSSNNRVLMYGTPTFPTPTPTNTRDLYADVHSEQYTYQYADIYTQQHSDVHPEQHANIYTQ